MEDLETSWGEVVISGAVATLVEVSLICIPALNHTAAGTFDSGVYMSIRVASSASTLKN